MNFWISLFHAGAETPDSPVHSLASVPTKLSWLLCIFVESFTSFCGPGSSVGIATGYGLEAPGFESLWGRDFPHLSIPAVGPTQFPV